jgi:hypothetical protein
LLLLIGCSDGENDTIIVKETKETKETMSAVLELWWKQKVPLSMKHR